MHPYFSTKCNPKQILENQTFKEQINKFLICKSAGNLNNMKKYLHALLSQ